jgi:hypothetical protein
MLCKTELLTLDGLNTQQDANQYQVQPLGFKGFISR